MCVCVCLYRALHNVQIVCIEEHIAIANKKGNSMILVTDRRLAHYRHGKICQYHHRR